MTKTTEMNWSTTRIRRALYQEIEKALQTEAAKADGLTNVAQFVDISIRELLAKVNANRMSHLNMHDDHVKIIDNAIGRMGRIVSVYFKVEGKTWCEYCTENNCIHVQYAWELPEVSKILREKGLSPP